MASTVSNQGGSLRPALALNMEPEKNYIGVLPQVNAP
jgi:hypothetical protein